jgi:hypothetical protein
MPSGFEGVSGDPLFSLKCHIHQRLEIMEPKRSPIAPRPGLIPPISLTFCQIVALMLPHRSVNRGVGLRCQAAMRSHGAVQRLDQRPSIRRPWPWGETKLVYLVCLVCFVHLVG